MKKGIEEGLGILKYMLGIAIAVIAVAVLIGAIAIVPAGFKGVLLVWGAAQDQPFEQGLHFITPIISSVQMMDLRTQTTQTDADAASKDLQSVIASVAVNFHIDSEVVVSIYKKYGANYQDRVNIKSMIEESVKASTARFTAEELITKREDLKSMIKEELDGRLQQYSIITETVNIVNFAFSEQFNKAIEEKVTATQQALTAQRTLERIKFEAEQKVAQAQGEANATLTKAQAEAQSIEIRGRALKENPQVATLEWINKWDGVLPNYMLGSAIPLLNIPVTG